MSLFSSSYYTPRPVWREHICGLYYVIPYNGRLQKTYLPQVELQAHATILATTSRTVLTQTFINPSTEKGIKEVRYTFPLYDGVSVVGFTCHVGDRTIVGEVKEKEKARAVFQEAVARGETAGLLEQLPEASDVFTTTVGNVPPGARVIINITYLGELKHDMEVDGIRFTIPNVICPRYGNYPGDLRTTPAITAMGSSISITVDAEMAEGSFIQKMQSPSHPIAMTMGTTSFAPNADPSMTKASATLTLGTAELDTDFVLQIIAKDTGIPKAVLENHPTIPNHRALMATLVPKFALPAEKPEIVFVVDRSGSMAGSRMDLVNQALKVFLKSLPVGVKFNICSFGSSHSFLWKKSVTYSQKSLDEAVKHVQGFTANFGGTEMLHPLKATIEQRYKDMPLDVMMLTDGEIWNQQALFTYLNKSVTESKAPIRIFTLGIGNGVSHALIEGVAKAGNGFSQTVGEGEKMDTKVVRMLKGALSPHVNDYTLEVKYTNSTATSEEDDDFEIVEKVADSLKVQLDLDDKDEKRKSVGFQSKAIRAFFTNPTQKKPISLFDTSADPDKEDPPAKDETGEARYAHLPKVPVPKILQAPQNIPSLFAFNRTTVYLLLGPDAPQATPKSVVLRGTSNHGPLELEIPIQVLDLPGETIHQLAAKKAISELEQGRGWLPEARTESGILIKTKFEGRFEDMVEREAVRLGVQFQVGGKWCSFVAVESNKKNLEEKEREAQGWEWLEDEAPVKSGSGAPPKYTFSESDDSLDEDEIESNLEHLSDAVKKLRTLGAAMGKEVDEQNAMIDCISYKSANVDAAAEESPRRISSGSRRMARKVKLPAGGPPAPQDSYSYASSSPRSAQLQQQVDSTVSVMRSNITNVTERGERLDSLVEKSAPLSASAEGFRKGAARKKSAGLFGGLFGSSQPSPPPPPPPSSADMSIGGSIQSSRSRSSGLGGMFGGGFSASRSSSMASAPAPQPPMAPMVSASYIPAAYSYGASAPSSPPPRGAPAAQAAFGAAPPAQQSEQLQDYQSQLMLLEQQNKKRLLMARQENDAATPTASALPPPPLPVTNPFGNAAPPSGGTLFGAAPPPSGAALFGSAPPPPGAPGSTWHTNAPAAPITPMSNTAFSSHRVAAPAISSEEISFSNAGDAAALENFDFDSFLNAGDGGDAMDIDFSAEHKKASTSTTPPRAAAPPAPTPSKSPEELLHHLISLQTFEGSWEWTPALISSLGLNSALLAQEAATGVDKKQLATALVIAVFEEKLASFRGSWELVVDKARDWLDGEAGPAEALVARARKVLL